jgi:hypothetical protein
VASIPPVVPMRDLAAPIGAVAKSSAAGLRSGVSATGLQWSGPALAALGLFAIAAIAPFARADSFTGWFLRQAFAPERVFPLLGLGIACGLVEARSLAVTLLLFGLGIAGGFAAQDRLVALIYTALEGPTHLFLTGPIASIAVGLALVPGAGLLAWLLPIAAMLVGATLALAIFLTDPRLHDPVFTWSSLLAAFWIVAAVSLTLRAFRRAWFPICARIFGSWLVAAGLLYGGASLMPILRPPPPPTDTSQESTRGAELTHSIQSRHGSMQPLPGGIPGTSKSKRP